MFSFLNPYVMGGAILAAVAIGGGSYLWGYSSGKETILNRLKDDRITILKDGQAVDNEVLAADTDQLCAMLGGCE